VTFEITSPHYPDNYGPNHRCLYYIHNPFNNVLTIKFFTFDVEYDRNCSVDYLMVSNPILWFIMSEVVSPSNINDGLKTSPHRIITMWCWIVLKAAGEIGYLHQIWVSQSAITLSVGITYSKRELNVSSITARKPRSCYLGEMTVKDIISPSGISSLCKAGNPSFKCAIM